MKILLRSSVDIAEISVRCRPSRIRTHVPVSLAPSFPGFPDFSGGDICDQAVADSSLPYPLGQRFGVGLPVTKKVAQTST